MRWGQLGNPSSHWTIGLSRQWFYVGLLVLTILHGVLSVYLPPLESELLTWAAAKHNAFGSVQNPPIVEMLVRFSTAIFGDTLFGLRFPAVILSSFTILILSTITARHHILGLALLTPAFVMGSVLIAAEVPLLCFWSLYLFWLIQANRILNEWHGDPVTRVYRRSPVSFASWALGGALIGLGIASHELMALAIPCTLAVLVTKYRLKGWIAGFGVMLLTTILIVACFMKLSGDPLWIPFQSLWAKLAEAKTLPVGMGSFLYSQLIIVGALPFFLFPIALLKSPELCDEPRMQVCFHFFFLPMIFFLALSWRHHLEGHWALVAYLSFLPLAQWMIDYTSFRGLVRATVVLSFLVPFLASLLLFVHLLYPLRWVPLSVDKLSAAKAQYAFAQTLANIVKKDTNEVPLFSQENNWWAYFSFLGVPSHAFMGSQMASSKVASDPCALPEILLFHDLKTPPEALHCFGQVELMGEYPLKVRDTETARFSLIKYRK